MLTLRGEYIAMLAFADICAFICTLCVLWLALRVSSILSLKREADRLGYREDRSSGHGQAYRPYEEEQWDEEQFGYQVKPLPSERGRRQPPIQVEPQDTYTADEVDSIVQRAMDRQRRQDEMEFGRNARPRGVRPR